MTLRLHLEVCKEEWDKLSKRQRISRISLLDECGAKEYEEDKKHLNCEAVIRSLNVLWKMQLGNVLWKSGHIPNSVCFHLSSLMKTSCSCLI